VEAMKLFIGKNIPWRLGHDRAGTLTRVLQEVLK
jgi:hypothetical protein